MIEFLPSGKGHTVKDNKKITDDHVLILFCIVTGFPLLIIALIGVEVLPDVEFLWHFALFFFVAGSFVGICVEQANNKRNDE